MLRRFSVSNYRSFKDEAVMDFTLTRRDRGQGWSQDVPSSKKNSPSLSLVAGVFGANASGKSVFLKALSFVLSFMRSSAWWQGPESSIPVMPWFKKTEPCCFILEYYNHTGELFRYELDVTRTEVVREVLSRLSAPSSQKWDKMFERHHNEIHTAKGAFAELNHKLLRSNASYLSMAAQQGAELSEITDAITTMMAFDPQYIGRIPLSPLRIVVGHMLHAFMHAAKSEERAKKKQLFQDMQDFLCEADLGLKGIKLEKDPQTFETDGGPKTKVYGVHSIEGEGDISLPFALESEGTQTLFSFLFFIFFALEHGQPVIIDELDATLHFSMIEKILALFADQDKNPKGAQIIFTTHSDTLMNTLGKAHIYLTEKRANESELWRLDEIKGVRSTDNYQRKYLAGAYGGVPLL